MSATTVSCYEALRVARADAEAVYGDLTHYRIIVALQPDGWHIDYELDDPTEKGGGRATSLTPVMGGSSQNGTNSELRRSP